MDFFDRLVMKFQNYRISCLVQLLPIICFKKCYIFFSIYIIFVLYTPFTPPPLQLLFTLPPFSSLFTPPVIYQEISALEILKFFPESSYQTEMPALFLLKVLKIFRLVALRVAFVEKLQIFAKEFFEFFLSLI